jgi:hypothetical protein
MNPAIHRVTTRWIRGFTTFQLVWRTRNVMLVMPA